MGTINFVLVGARNTGKTCYLAVLASHCPGVTTASNDTTAYLKVQRQLLDSGELPQATASTMRELLFRYSGSEHNVDFSIDDYDGSFIESLSRSNTEDDESRNGLKEQIQASEGLMFFMPYETNPDQDTLSNFEDEINTIISLIEEITQGKYKTLPIPAVICVTKWDRSPDYKHDNEIEAAKIYLDKNPCYQRACAKINRLFEHVMVQPLSAFGATSDGIHPTKGSITPYGLEEPLLYCFDKTFQRYEQKIAEFQKNNDELGLFDYLSELYDDLKHCNDGQYCHLYDELEKQHTDSILQEIKKHKQLILTKSQQSFYDNVRQIELIETINEALQSHQSSKKSNRIFGAVGTFVALVSMVVGGVYYTQTQTEQKEFAALQGIISNHDIPAMETIHKVLAFNESWKKPLGLPLPTSFESDKQALNKATSEMLRMRLKSMVAKAKESNVANVELRGDIVKFSKVAEDWSDTELRQTVEHEVRPILDSYDLLTRLRDNVAKASTFELSDYSHQKTLVASTSIHWAEMDRLLNDIHTAIVLQIKTDAVNASKSGDLDELERSVEQLTALVAEGNTDAGVLLKDELQPALDMARHKEQFNTLVNDVDDQGSPSEIAQSIQDHWILGLTEEEKNKIGILLQSKFEAFESKNTPSMKELRSRDEIKGISDKLKKLKAATSKEMNIADDFTFRYMRPDSIQIRLMKWKGKFEFYQKYLNDGVNGSFSFSVIGNNPLGFNCSMTHHDIEIKINPGQIHLPDNEQKICSGHSLTWRIAQHLKLGFYNVVVTEHGFISMSDETWAGSFKFSEHAMFKLINSGSTAFKMGSYQLMFKKL